MWRICIVSVQYKDFSNGFGRLNVNRLFGLIWTEFGSVAYIVFEYYPMYPSMLSIDCRKRGSYYPSYRGNQTGYLGPEVANLLVWSVTPSLQQRLLVSTTGYLASALPTGVFRWSVSRQNNRQSLPHENIITTNRVEWTTLMNGPNEEALAITIEFRMYVRSWSCYASNGYCLILWFGYYEY